MFKDVLKKNKLIVIVVSVLIFLIIVVPFLVPKGNKHRLNTGPRNVITDSADIDDSSESLDALTQQLHAVVKSNQNLRQDNQKLNMKNSGILRNIKQEVENSIDSELKSRGADDRSKINNLKRTLTDVNNQLKILKEKRNKSSAGYSIDSASSQSHIPDSFVTIPDISDRSPNISKVVANNNVISGKRKKDNIIPYFTIPSGSTLANSIAMSSLIGRVPVDGVVKSPYPFKIIIGARNLAANGLNIPGISGAIVQGITVGDMQLKCVKGYVNTITFVFQDGRISTTKLSNASDDDIGFNNSLGYISQPNGNPCFPGKFYSNAASYLSTIIALGALNTGGQAFARSQETAISNSVGGTTQSLTGSIGKFTLGNAVAGGTNQAMEWYTNREKNSFDAVYVPAGTRAVVNITQQIQINYDKKGRKIYYVHHKSIKNNTSLD